LGSYSDLRIGPFELEYSGNFHGISHQSIFHDKHGAVVERDFGDGEVERAARSTKPRWDRSVLVCNCWDRPFQPSRCGSTRPTGPTANRMRCHGARCSSWSAPRVWSRSHHPDQAKMVEDLVRQSIAEEKALARHVAEELLEPAHSLLRGGRGTAGYDGYPRSLAGNQLHPL
jgi:hypothetical protein